MGIIRSQLTVTLEKRDTALHYLQKSLDSLARVTLQNRKGLDLLFMEQGGICRALGEECCFYVDHSRIVTRTLDELRKDIDSFKSRTPYETWFNWSPWLTTLISSLIGPMAICLLICLFDPCVLQRLKQTFQNQIQQVQLMAL